MAYDEGTAQRVREAMQSLPGVEEKKMFGGIAFMVNGNMSTGVLDDELMLRVGPDLYEKALSRPHARPMDFTGRPMKGFVFVAPEGFETDSDLNELVELSYQFVRNLPPK